MPAGALVMVPLPAPSFLILRLKPFAANSAPADTFVVPTFTLHGEVVPVQVVLAAPVTAQLTK